MAEAMTPSEASSPSEAKPEKPGPVYASGQAQDLSRSVFRSTTSAIRSALTNGEFPTLHLQSIQDSIPEVKSWYKDYEDAIVRKVKEELISAREHPSAAAGIAIATGLLLLRGPRRLLFRQTFGRLQSEEAQFLKVERNVTELGQSIDLIKKESKKLRERASFAQEEMNRGHTKLKNAGREIQRLADSVYKMESQALDLVDGLREVPGREALRLRAEVASMASQLKQERTALNKRILKISDYGIAV
ncbi:RGS1-HXK1-interacting protein 1 [Nymphaea colorata]|nr:RGS1-HXK1-interacting protein 1 [Nymphaea colorata]